MTMSLAPLTRGGLQPAVLKPVDPAGTPDDEIKFMFNPYQYTLSKSNSWERETGKGTNVPVTSFTQGNAMSLTLEMHFDSYADNEDVRKYTNKLWKLMLIDPRTNNPETHKGRPPVVAFEWGALYFKAIVTKIDQNFTMFLADGKPVRCKATVTLEQYHDDGNRPPQAALMSGAAAIRRIPGMSLTAMLAAAAAAAAAAVVIAAASDRIDHVAQSSTGDAGNMRQVAERNNVDNPLKVRSGQTFS
jgi:hypothetical protein